MRAFTLAETAAELGRSADWLEDNWSRLVREKGMPMPLHEKGHKVWSAAHLYGWMDRDLTPRQRIAAAAYRAAVEAAMPAARREADAIADARNRLDDKFQQPARGDLPR